ncbi:hypothetical protein [Empedobacter stercoris]|uniref:Uncharacterized protein n=1 Tax=Empedobacter stercoris TaxID=1628248 RepID=A0ABX1WM15_9FLAO|nr:hypothetical protein [Empedobacter stercoris]NOJ75699.1 hypothetical protein [Empedobacter stercoris]
MNKKQPKLSDKIDVLIDQIVDLNKTINESNVSNQKLKTNSNQNSDSLFSNDTILIQKTISKLYEIQTSNILKQLTEFEKSISERTLKRFKQIFILVILLIFCNLFFMIFNQKAINNIDDKSKDDEKTMMIEFFKENPKNYATYLDWVDKNRVRKSNQ